MEAQGLNQWTAKEVPQKSFVSTKMRIDIYYIRNKNWNVFNIYLLKIRTISPLHGKSESQSRSVMSDSLGPHDYTAHANFEARILEWVAFPFSRGSFQPRSSTLPAMQADSLPAEPQGKPKNTGVGALSLLQWIFPTQELSQGLLHCRQILYQLSY